MYYFDNGEEMKKFNTRDGMGISRIMRAGIKTAIISSEKTDIIFRRAEKLGIDYVYGGVIDKSAVLDEIINKENCLPEDVAYIGDDLNDFLIMTKAGIAITVPDANETILNTAAYVTKRRGGEGAVREVCDLLLRKRSS
jgi:N-acylneuraminate cytidylyltransferase